MKISTHITAALLALGIVSQASADPVVYLTGSTAFRSTIDTSLLNNTGTNNGGVFDTGTLTYVTYGNANPLNANYLVVHGNISGSPVYIDVAWSGSEAGIASACNTTLKNTDRNGNLINLAGSPEQWLNVNAVTLNGSAIATNPPSSLLETNSDGTPNFHGSDLAQADTSQAVSWTPFQAGTQTALKDYGVQGVVTFSISKNLQTAASPAWNDVTNITIPQLVTLLGTGFVPASYLSANPSDNNQFVYIVGRNKGSGTRMNTLADSHYGTKSAVQQYSVGLGIEEPTTSSLILTNEGNNGYESGGGVVNALHISGSCQQTDPFTGNNGWFAIGYASPSDLLNPANTVGTNNWLTLDGVPESNGAIENGSYWFWGHEHLYGKYQISGIQDTVGNTIMQAVVLTLNNLTLGSVPGNHDPAIAKQYMNCRKTSDSAYPSPSGPGNP